MRREERVTVQGPVKEQQPDGMSHRGSKPLKPERDLEKGLLWSWSCVCEGMTRKTHFFSFFAAVSR